MLYELREDERSLPKALEILRLAEVREDNEGYISDFDAIMQQLGYEQFDLFDDTNEAWEELVLDAENGDLEKQKLVNHYIEEKNDRNNTEIIILHIFSINILKRVQEKPQNRLSFLQ